MRAPPLQHPAITDMNAASTSECLQMLLAASKCVSSEPENEEFLERKLEIESGQARKGRPRGTPRSSLSVTPNSSGTATPTGEMETQQGVEQWLERRKKQQSLAQSRYRNRQKEKQTNLKAELDRLRALAMQYQLTVVDPDALEEEEMNNATGLSDVDSSSALTTATPNTAAASPVNTMATTTPVGTVAPPTPTMTDPSAAMAEAQAAAANAMAVHGLMHQWSVSNPPQLSLTPQAIAQRKYRAKLKMKRARLQRQVELYSRVLQAHLSTTPKIESAPAIMSAPAPAPTSAPLQMS